MSSRPGIENSAVRGIGKDVFVNIRCLSHKAGETFDVFLRGFEYGKSFMVSGKLFKNLDDAAHEFKDSIVKYLGKEHDLYQLSITHKKQEPNASQCEFNSEFGLLRLE